MSTETTPSVPSKRPVHVVRRTTLWEGDLVSIHVPERAKVLTFDQGGEKFTYLSFQFAIFGEKFVDVFVRSAGSELIGTEIVGWLSIWEKRLSDGRICRYIDVEPADEADLDEPAYREFKVVPNWPDEVEMREGWMFYGIPHPFKHERTLRGAILLYPLGDKVRIRKPAAEPAAKAAEVDQPAPAAAEPKPAETVPAQTVPESVPAPKPKPVRMGEGPRQPQKTHRVAKPAAETPRADLAQLKELAENGFGLRPQEGTTAVF